MSSLQGQEGIDPITHDAPRVMDWVNYELGGGGERFAYL